MGIQKIYLELTDRCNLNCSICYRQSWAETPKDMAPLLYDKLLTEIAGIETLKTVVLGGVGEPSCAEAFLNVLEDLKDYTVILTTNGADIGEDALDKIVTCVDTVVVSVDGMENTFADIRGISLSTVKQTILKLQEKKQVRKAMKPAIHLQCVLSKDNVQDALPLVDLAAELKADALIFSNLMPQTEENRDKILYTEHENEPMRSLFDKLRMRSFRKGLQLVLPHVTIKTERFCSFIEEEAVFVSANGDVVPCYRFSHGYREYVFGRPKSVQKHSFGNLEMQSLEEIWESDEYVRYRNHVRHGRYPSCVDCDFVDGCEYVTTSSADCWGNGPSCADCLWSRRIVICP